MMNPEEGAAHAARRAEEKYEDMPSVVMHGQLIGKCPDCEEKFNYGSPSDGVDNLDPCPECGSMHWRKWGYRYKGEEYHRDETPR